MGWILGFEEEESLRLRCRLICLSGGGRIWKEWVGWSCPFDSIPVKEEEGGERREHRFVVRHVQIGQYHHKKYR